MSELVPKEDNVPTTPGIGISGTVLCPFGFQKSPCLKNGCELWTELTYGDSKVARCSLAWIPIVSVELRQELEKFRPKDEDAEVS